MSVPNDETVIRNANYDQEMIPALEHSPLRFEPKSPLGLVAHPRSPKTVPHVIRAWPALTPQEREAGLQFCTRLERNTGVLFVFPGEFYWPMWMKNTFIPLDIVFLRSRFADDGTVACSIVDIQRGTPGSLDHIIPRETCDMVLEMREGEFGFTEEGRRGVSFLSVSGYETALLRAIRVCPPDPIAQPDRSDARPADAEKGDDSLPPPIGSALGFSW